jgi:hypothetical protein
LDRILTKESCGNPRKLGKGKLGGGTLVTITWLHDSGLATWATVIVVLYYAIETARTRRQLVVQNQRAVLPFITVDFANDEFSVRNIAASPALNVSIDPIPISDDFNLKVAFAIAYTLSREDGSQSLPYNSVVGDTASPSRLSWARNFFPQQTSVERRMTIRFQTVEGKRFKQLVIIRPIRTSERPIEICPVVSDDNGVLARLKTLFRFKKAV